MTDNEEYQFPDAGDGNVMMKKYLALRNKCEQIQQGNERLVNRLQHVKKLIRSYSRQKRFLQRRLDNYKDNYREAQVPVMWEEDQVYSLLKPAAGLNPGAPIGKESKPSTSRPKQSRKIKTVVKTEDPGARAGKQTQENFIYQQNEQILAQISTSMESPKRPASAFMMFCDQYKQSIRNEYMREKKTVIPQAELTKRLTQKWNSLEPEDKKIYFDMFEIERRSAEEEAAGLISQNALDSMYLESDNAVSSLLAGQEQL